VNRALVVAVALALAYPATAAAKEIAAVKVCGASGCRGLSKAVVDRIGEGSNGETFAPAPPLQPFYRLVYTVKAAPGETFGGGKTESTYTSWYVPGAHVTQSVDEAGYIVWYPVTGEFAEALAKLTAHLRPNAAPKLTSVRVDGRDVERPQSYTRLLERGEPTDLVAANDWRSVLFYSTRPSPWTRGGILMDVSPHKHALYRGGLYVKLPRRITDAAAAALPLPGSGGSFPWSYLALVLALAAAVAVALVVTRAKPSRPRPRPETV
jgi:hypothetical protein